MGLVETVLQHLSLKFTLTFLVIAYAVWHILNRIHEHRRIRRLGQYGPYLRPRLPLGISISHLSPNHSQTH